MEHDKIQQFYDEVLKSEIAKGSLNDAFGKIQSEEDLRKFIQDSMIPLARANGYDFTEEDVMAHEKRNMAKRELTDDELDEVVGGAMPRSLILSLPIMMLLGSVYMGGESASAIGTSGTAISWNNEGSIVETVSQKEGSMDVGEFVKSMVKRDSSSVENSEEQIAKNVVSSEQDAIEEGQTAKNTEVSEVENHVADTQSLGSVNLDAKEVGPVYEAGKRVFSNVMRIAAAINHNFGEQKITDIAMFGAHDACTNEISKNSQISFSPTGALKNPIVRTVGKEVSARYAKAQSARTCDLLKSGVRMLDIRASHEKGDWWTTHSMISGKLADPLKDTINFLIDNPGEFVVFHIGLCVSEIKGEGAIDLAKYISTVTVERDGRSYNLYDFVNYDAEHENLSDLTYNKVTANGSKGGVYISMADKVNAIASDEVCPTKGVKYKRLIQNGTVAEEWLDAQTTEEIMNGMTSACERNFSRYPNRFRMCQYQTSPNANEIAWNGVFKGGSLLKNAEGHNARVIDDIRFDENMKTNPICWFDNVTTNEGGFNRRVNEKILQYNMRLNNSVTTSTESSYQKISKTSELKDDMKIALISTQGNSQYYGDSFSAKKNSGNLSQNDQGWTLVKSGNGFKLMLSNGKYVKREGTSRNPKLSTTSKENNATPFNFSEISNGKFKITAGNYALRVNDGRMVLVRNVSNAGEFDVRVRNMIYV